MNKLPALLMVGSALLLASCNQTDMPSNLNNVSGTVVEGSLDSNTVSLVTSAWTGGAGTVIAVTGLDAEDAEDDQELQELARTSLSADGKFSLNLPEVAAGRLAAAFDGSYSTAEGCTGTLSVSNPQARTTALVVGVDANKDGVISPVSINSSFDSARRLTGTTIVFGDLVYVDRGVNIRGTQTCTDDQGTIVNDVNLTLRKGWNKVSLSIKLEASSSDVTLTTRSGSYPDNWVYLNTDVPSGATPLSVRGLGGETLSLQSLKTQFQLPFLR